MIYFDSAYLAKFYLAEPESARVQAAALEAGAVACSVLGRVETLSVFHRKLREKTFEPRAFNAICAQFQADQAAGLWTWLPLSEAVLDATEKKIRKLSPAIFLRTVDALHLATAAEHGLPEILSNDRHLIAAAPQFGLKARSL